MKFYPRIGLEIHAELTTRTKCFCDCKNDPDEVRPNINICPVCMGYPGTLPVPNKQAVKHVLTLGVAIDGKLADFTEFDRKHYFYPDIPKGYQISQYKYPLVSGGSLSGVPITRVHLEEDTARSQHQSDGSSLIDFNRSGVPLMELVTEPTIVSGEEASAFGKEFQLLIQTLKIGYANLEKGEMRVEANISVSDKEDGFGTKVEIKNLNSFRAVEKAIDYEIERQSKLLEAGEKVSQETRGWDDKKGVTFSQRSKEDSHDYRYFPDPDIPKLKLSEMGEFSREAILSSLPELPSAKRERLASLGLKSADAEVLVRDRNLLSYFDEFAGIAMGDRELVLLGVNYLLTDILPLRESNPGWQDNMTPAVLRSLVALIKEGVLSSRGAKNVISIIVEHGGDPADVAKREGLIQQSDDSFTEELVSKIIKSFPEAVEEYKSGKTASLQFLIGQAMKESKGSGNPAKLREFFVKAL